MYSEEFMAYLAGYKMEERKEEKKDSDNFFTALLKLFFKLA